MRGLTVALMILVNNSGDGAHSYPLLQHSRWNGCTLADLVFPGFLFMVGLSSVYAVAARQRQGASSREIVFHALRRGGLLFCLGILINIFPFFHLDTLRVFGVLQRIALCSLAASLLLLHCRFRALVGVVSGILLGYWVLLRWMPVPGLGWPGVNIAFLDPYANFPAWLDRHLLPASHLYHQSFYDPEGLLSTLPALATTLTGALTGMWLRKFPQKSFALLASGITMLAVSLLWAEWLPWNKRLWTSSYALGTAAISLLAFWLLHQLLDGEGKRTAWSLPAKVFGVNALAAYLFSELLALTLAAVRFSSGVNLQKVVFYPIAAMVPDLSLAALIYSILFVLVCLLMASWLYIYRVFIKL
jgi:predicted acyltransferase